MKDIALFDYQKEMRARIDDAFKSHRSVMVQMPTGTGKTHLLAAVVQHEVQKQQHGNASNDNGRPAQVWIVAHRRELVAQIADTLRGFLASYVSTAQTTDPLAGIRVTSIQWLSRHFQEMSDSPSLIVIDEAHHALAETYAAVMKAFPKARKLGLTATPCRMNGCGFTDLFDVLLTSWSIKRFMADGRLSAYDYFSVRPDSASQMLVDSLCSRGADGDYLQKELDEVMDVRPSLERLCQSVQRYAPNRKGIVYAVSIAHAEHIADFYRQNDVNAVAVSSITPLDVRQMLIDKFKKGEVKVLVSVDLFSEGFDCPDVEFVQLARPTLSLSRYLQMVGRGLRVADGKDYCVILDNVGLYRRFGLPSADRDWQSMFLGRTRMVEALQEACLRIGKDYASMVSIGDGGDDMSKIWGHDRQLQTSAEGNDFGYVQTKGKNGKTQWLDEISGLRFDKHPQSVWLMGMEFCTEDGKRLYPRLRSQFLDEKAYLNLKTLQLQVGRGINWKRRLMMWNESGKMYMLKEKLGSVRLYVDDAGEHYVQGCPDMPLTHIRSQEEMDAYCSRTNEKEEVQRKAHETRYLHGHMYPIHERNALSADNVSRLADNLWYVSNDVYGESYWVDGITGMKHFSKPILCERGFVRLIRDGEWFYVRNIPGLADKPLRGWQIVADDHVCVVNNEFLFLKQEPRLWLKIIRKADDFSYFVVREYSRMFKNNVEGVDIIITQTETNGLKIEKDGVPYTPSFQLMPSMSSWH